MSFWEKLRRAWRPRPASQENDVLARRYTLDDELLRSVKYLAQRERRSEDEVAAELLTFALEHRSAAEHNLALWQSLTPREQETVALACQNLTNRQIAARMHISPDTVKTHLRNGLRKIGVQGKQELRQALADWDFSSWKPEPRD